MGGGQAPTVCRTDRDVDRPVRATTRATTVASPVAPAAIDSPTGPTGRLPKKRLRPGTSTTVSSATAETMAARHTEGSLCAETAVWASWAPTSASIATLLARRGV